jgi:hypothetical protein
MLRLDSIPATYGELVTNSINAINVGVSASINKFLDTDYSTGSKNDPLKKHRSLHRGNCALPTSGK